MTTAPTPQDPWQSLILERLDTVLTQVKDTNGRVRKLELWKAKVEGAREALGHRKAGTVLFISTVTAAVIGALTGAVGTAIIAHLFG